jgi:hypothetical protein
LPGIQGHQVAQGALAKLVSQVNPALSNDASKSLLSQVIAAKQKHNVQ